jgi:hypothetical protein
MTLEAAAGAIAVLEAVGVVVVLAAAIRAVAVVVVAEAGIAATIKLTIVD